MNMVVIAPEASPSMNAVIGSHVGYGLSLLSAFANSRL